MKRPYALLSLALTTCVLTACGGSEPAGISPERMADALHTVLEADRTIYIRKVVNRTASTAPAPSPSSGRH